MATSSLILNLIVRDQASSGLSKAAKGFTALAGVATVAGLGLGSVVSKAADFDKTIRQVGAAAGVPAAGLKNLSDLALKMGADTSFSAQQAAQAMLELSKGGITEAQIKAGALESTLTLAAAGGLELSSAATYMSNSLNTFGLEAKDSAAVAAALAGGANSSTASVESLGSALSQVGPSAKLSGLSIQETVGALAAFDNAGIKGSDAGTSLKTMLLNLVPTTRAAADAMEDAGLSFYDANGEMLPLRDIAGKLQTQLGGLSAAEQQVALKTMFGTDAFRAAAVMMDLGRDGVDKYVGSASNLNAAQEMAATNTAGAAGAFEAFKGSVETLGLRIGLALLPAVEAVTRGATELVNGLGSAFEGALSVVGDFRSSLSAGGNPFAAMADQARGIADSIRSTFTDSIVPIVRNLIDLLNPLAVDAFRGVATVVGAVLMPAVRGIAEAFGLAAAGLRGVTGFLAEHKTAVQATVVAVGTFIAIMKGAMIAQRLWMASIVAFAAIRAAFIGGLAAMRGAVIAFNLALRANPIGIIITALVALGAGLVYAYKKSETFRNIVNGAFGAVKAGAMAVFDFVKKTWPFLLTILMGPFGLLIVAVVKNFNTIKSAVMSAFDAIKGAAMDAWENYLRPAFTSIKDMAVTVGTALASAFRTASEKVREAFTVIRNLWTGTLQPVFAVIANVVKNIAEFYFKVYFNAAKLYVQTAFAVIRTLWNNVLMPVFNAVKSAVKLLADGFRLSFNIASAVVRTAFNVIQSVWNTVLKPVFNLARAAVGVLVEWFRRNFDTIALVVRTAFNVARSVYNSVLVPMFNAAKSAVGVVRTVFTTVMGAIQDKFRTAFDAMRAVWSNVLKPTFDAIKDAIGKVKGAFSAAVDGIQSAWERIKSIVSKPVEFVINSVIRPLAQGLDKIAGAFGLNVPVPDAFGGGGGGLSSSVGRNRGGGPTQFASGGIMPGYTPGRDNQLIAVGGGEAIMRPEWTRAVGSSYVSAMNSAARSGGISGVQKALGLPGYALGGIVSGIKDKATSAIKGGANLATGAFDFLTDPLAALRKIAEPLLGKLKGGSIPSGPFGDILRKAPGFIFDKILAQAKGALGGLLDKLMPGGGSGGAMSGGKFAPGVQGGLNFARAHAGRPYVWGAAGPGGFDCSGFIAAIQNTIQGRNPYGRLYSTHSFYGGMPGGWSRGGGGAFSIGVIAQRGSTPGHMAGTINGVNVESRGGIGTLVGPRARGTNNSLFTDRFSFGRFARGGVVGDPPFDLPYGKAVRTFDSGGIARGPGFMPKYTAEPERVLSPRQTAAFESWMESGGGETHIHVHNTGVIGSRIEVENWLAKSLKSLERQGRR